MNLLIFLNRPDNMHLYSAEEQRIVTSVVNEGRLTATDHQAIQSITDVYEQAMLRRLVAITPTTGSGKRVSAPAPLANQTSIESSYISSMNTMIRRIIEREIPN